MHLIKIDYVEQKPALETPPWSWTASDVDFLKDLDSRMIRVPEKDIIEGELSLYLVPV